MAATVTGFAGSSMDSCPNIENGAINEETNHMESEKKEEGIMAGAQISKKLKFKDSKGSEINVIPVMIDFKLLIQSGGTADVVPGVRNILFVCHAMYCERN